MTSKNNSIDNCQDNRHVDESTKSLKIKEVHFRISQGSLEKWDDFRKTRLGNMSRTALIMNAVEIYMLIMQRQLEADNNGIKALKSQLDSILQLLIYDLHSKDTMFFDFLYYGVLPTKYDLLYISIGV